MNTDLLVLWLVFQFSLISCNNAGDGTAHATDPQELKNLTSLE
jgi:hypothetical protein